MTKPVTICPPGKAYGYDRETLNKRDRETHDWSRASDYDRTQSGKRRATIVPGDAVLEPRGYDGDPE